LRHFYAITLIEAGNLGPKTIQTRLGHATIGETYDTYGRWFRDDEEQGRGVIESMFSEQPSRSELTSS
jgi:integrase